MTFPTAFLDELRRRVPVSWAVGKHVKLRRRGRDLIGLCPFHKEKTPSFNVIDDKQMFHCFGCGSHGDVIAAVMRLDRIDDFREAVTIVARQAGLEIPEETPEQRARQERSATLHEAIQAAADFYQRCLAEAAGSAARNYLRGRGFTDDDFKRWQIGYAPATGHALLFALEDRFPVALLIEAGLVHRNPDRGDLDFFRGRMMFPIADHHGRLCGFGARKMPSGPDPKYLNTPETPIFHKSALLYGFRGARETWREQPPLIVEGYLDVIACHRHRLTETVAPLGTALTEQHIETLWKHSDAFTLCFDGDPAGQRAADRAALRIFPMLRPGKLAKVAFLPEGKDPDSALADDPASMRDALNASVPLAESVFRWQLNAIKSIDDPDERAYLENRLEARVATIADKTVQHSYRVYMRRRFFETIRGPQRRKNIKRPSAPPPSPDPLRRRREEALIATALHHPWIAADRAEEFVAVPLSADLHDVRGKIMEAIETADDLAWIIELIRETTAPRLLSALIDSQHPHAPFADPTTPHEDVTAGWDDLVAQLCGETMRRELAEDAKDFATDPSEETWRRLAAQRRGLTTTE